MRDFVTVRDCVDSFMGRLAREKSTPADKLLVSIERWFDAREFSGSFVIIVAVSGGLDSMVLLDLLNRISSIRLNLHVAHFDHRLRPESEADAIFVRDQSARLGLPITMGSEDVRKYASSTKISVEMAGRELRYMFLENVMSNTGSTHIAFGHHANDQAETVLLRLLRGSSSGLGGMAPVRDGRYLRPLLDHSRDTLATYAKLNKVSYRDDPSNRDSRFLRNRVRHELLPKLSSFNPNIVGTLLRSSELLRDENDWLANATEEAKTKIVIRDDPMRVILAVGTLVNYHIAIQRRVLRQSVLSISGPRVQVDRAVIDTLVDLVQSPHGRIAEIGSNVVAQCSLDRLVLSSGPAQSVDRLVRVPASLDLPERSLKLQTQYLPGSSFSRLVPRLGVWEAAFDAESLGAAPISLRGIKPGDRMQPFGLEGRHKKLSDMLIDAQHPRLLRDEILILVQGSEILWVVGLRTCEAHRVSIASKHILHCAFSHVTSTQLS